MPTTVQGLPATTYSPQGNESFDLNPPDPSYYTLAGSNYAHVVAANYMGTLSCNPDDFTEITLYVLTPGDSGYSEVTPLFYSGGGCLKWNQVYAIPLSAGTSSVVACVSNEDGSQNYCAPSLEVSTNPNEAAWQ